MDSLRRRGRPTAQALDPEEVGNEADVRRFPFFLFSFPFSTSPTNSSDFPPLPFFIPFFSAPTRRSWPSHLDNTVAGGITSSQTPYESILRECAEEASLPPSYTSPRIKQTGVLCYHYRTTEGWIQPEVQWVYDLPMDGGSGGTRPTTNPEDGEVESFELMELGEVVERMVAGEFKPNCALYVLLSSPIPPSSR
jgi:8-oxo-dGTP pyrophosphatase MutT (NUDIX family)